MTIFHQPVGRLRLVFFHLAREIQFAIGGRLEQARKLAAAFHRGIVGKCSVRALDVGLVNARIDQLLATAGGDEKIADLRLFDEIFFDRPEASLR